jgi:BirA family biotin operon repressor/biotin-[acetyl-CoA-carboxylase] ligase
MLVENGLDGTDIAWSVIGIGINLNQTEFPGEVMNATSLKRLTGRTYDPFSFLETVCAGLERWLPELGTQEGRDRLRNAYERDLFQKGSPAPYRDLTTGEEFSGIIRGITPEGLLRIEAEGREKTFGFKEISYIF